MFDNFDNSNNESSDNLNLSDNTNQAKTPDLLSDTMPEMPKPIEKAEVSDKAPKNIDGQAHLLQAMSKIASLPEEHLEALLDWPAESNVDAKAIRELFNFVKENRPETQVSQSFDVSEYSPTKASNLLSQLNKTIES
jgi:hypothetical protein